MESLIIESASRKDLKILSELAGRPISSSQKLLYSLSCFVQNLNTAYVIQLIINHMVLLISLFWVLKVILWNVDQEK